jgi:hypothetical protein
LEIPSIAKKRLIGPRESLTANRPQLLNRVSRIEPDRVGKVEKFHNIDAALPTFDRGNE